MTHDVYQSPFSARYASPEMLHLFSPQFRHQTWRHLWVALAQAEHELGLPVSSQQIEELKQHTAAIDFERVAVLEQELQHDVMAHVLAYGEQCPLAKPIIHLGATSCYVTDNGDLIQMQQGLSLLQGKLKKVIHQLANFAQTYANMPCLGFTHFQPASLTTVGKRACLWLQDLLIDFHELKSRRQGLRFLGVKGATGTQASFLELFNQQHEKVEALDKRVAELMGFSDVYIISGQTYTRKQDMLILQALSGIAVSAHKFATDLRLLAHLKEIEEPFSDKQIGSSAMPYKRNPIYAERVCALARFLLSLGENPSYTAATQWLERTLDDSANRRLCVSEAFLACDAILNLLIKLTSNLVVYPQMIAKNIREELPFLALENILMACTRKGGDRQVLHERLRQHSQAAASQIKEQGKENDLLERIVNDEMINLTAEELDSILDLKLFVGRAPDQVVEFINKEVAFITER